MAYASPKSNSNSEHQTDHLELVGLMYGRPGGISLQHSASGTRREARSETEPKIGSTRARKTTRRIQATPDSPEVSEIIQHLDMEAVKSIIRSRITACGAAAGGAYPFQLLERETFCLKRLWQHEQPPQKLHRAYFFMLVVTHHNMGTRRIAVWHKQRWQMHDKHRMGELKTFTAESQLDGGALFEHLCCRALRGLLGPQSRACRFGAGARENSQSEIAKALNDLTRQLGEGEPRPEEHLPSMAKDGGLDVVAWRPFAENDGDQGRKGMPMWFAQCKTGTSYDVADARRLDPTHFVEDFLGKPFATSSTNITRAFMVAERTTQYQSERLNRAGGVLLDRCRIMDCLGTTKKASGDASLDKNILNWLVAALNKEDYGELTGIRKATWLYAG